MKPKRDHVSIYALHRLFAFHAKRQERRHADIGSIRAAGMVIVAIEKRIIENERARVVGKSAK
jgi:hypothetical protein